jgi:hypothetical protein
VEGNLAGSIQPLAYLPEPGFLSAGTGSHLQFAGRSCFSGPTLLGAVLVNDPSGGDLCFVPTASGRLGVTGCVSGVSDVKYDWPKDVKITGVRTDGGTPCSSGRGCDEIGDAAAVAATVLEEPPFPTFLEPARPNPSSRGFLFDFTLETEQRVALSVFDVRGRLVRSLLDGVLPAGRHSAGWDGRSDAGERMPAGVYFGRLAAGEHAQTRKIVVLPGAP